MLHPAQLFKTLPDNAVQCICCSHRCYMKPAEKGKCLVRINQEGQLFTKAYGNLIAQHVDPIEKKPLYHFYPGSLAYSISISGCNFFCQWCQNWDISQGIRLGYHTASHETSPEDVVQSALAQQCTSIAFTYTEPTIFFEYTMDVSRLARHAGVKNVYVTNGYMTGEMIELYSPWLDAANVDIKAFSEKTYHEFIGAHLKPVLDACINLKKHGVWLEITTLVIPGINDDPSEMRELALFIKNELGSSTPWHISRFHPDFKFKGVPATPMQTLLAIEAIGHEVGLEYVYIGNASLESNTVCPACGELLIQRWGMQVEHNKITSQSNCPKCGHTIAGVGLSGQPA